jgi:mono/diheme cytochrome c family protein
MRRLIPAAMLLIAGCTTSDAEGGNALASSERIASGQPGSGLRQGDSFASMSRQYIPRSGPYSATGASAWVPSAPAPAFVASGPPPPADPPAPDPLAAAVSRPSAAPASEVARPEAGAPAVPGPALRTAGLALFNNASCGTCHALADAGATGAIGPAFDRNPRLSRAFAIDVITTGRGAMPSFAGQLSDAEIATLADYLVAFGRK